MIKIISDSTCDLSEGLLGKYNISLLPHHVILDKSDYRDGVDITTDETYDWADDHRTTPKTAAASIEEVINLFKPIISGDNEIICFSVSKEISNCYNIMKLAAKTLEAEDRIHVIDSANISTGIGHLVIEAAILAAQGMSSDNIIARIEELKPLVCSSFIVDTPTYLYSSGRYDSFINANEETSKVHPMMVVDNGNMVIRKKYYSEINTIIDSYFKDLKPALLNAKPDRIFITHAGCSESTIEEFHSYLEGLNYFKEIYIAKTGAVTSSHCGYGTLGVSFISK